MGLYLDNAATCPLSDEMKEYLVSVLDLYGNPSSDYSKGFQTRELIENTRNKVAKFIGIYDNDNIVNSNCIVFTSSGSASNTLGIKGYVETNDCEVFYPPTLHKSALKCIDSLDCDCVALNIDSKGVINIYDLNLKLSVVKKKPFVVIEYANSENGTIQPIRDIIELAHDYDGIVMVDCTGSISSIPLDVIDLDIDIAVFSGHKIGALKGVAVLYKKPDIELKSLVCGAQENGLFAGTENILGIASLGKAIDLKMNSDCRVSSYSRDFVWNNLKKTDDVYLVGADIKENRLVNNIYICIKGINGQELVTMMDDLYDTQISTGSACNNGNATPSPTLLAMGIPEDDMLGCVRITFGGYEIKEELQKFCENLSVCVNMLKKNK